MSPKAQSSNSKSDETVSKTTKDHETIQKWVEERGGVPATVGLTKKEGEIGLLRIKFPEAAGGAQSLVEISWDDFFAKFDENNLMFLYQEKTKDGNLSRFFKFVSGK